MRASVLVAFAFASALLAAVACSGSSSDAVSSSGSSGTEPPASSSGTSGTSGSAGTSGSSGGASGSSGTSGSGGTDGGSDAGPDGGGGRDYSANKAAFFGASRCAGAGLGLCDDFESGTLDKTTWSVVGTAPVIDGLQHARGTKALHITMNGNGASYIKETKTFPAAKNTYWGRVFVWFDALPVAPMTYSHWTFGAATGTGVQGEIRLSGQLQNGANHFGVGTDSGQSATGTGDWTSSDKDPANAPLAVPTKQWVCIEWLHKGDTNETKFYWDAVEHASLATTTTKHGGNANPFILPQFTAMWVGWQEYQPSTEKFEMWLDEVAVDATRIGCIL